MAPAIAAITTTPAGASPVGTWTALANTNGSRYSPGATVAGDGRLYAIGGVDWQGTAERYNPTSNNWTSIANMSIDRTWPMVITGADGKPYVFGGYSGIVTSSLSSGERYEAGTNTWTPLAAMPTPRHCGAAVSAGGVVYVIGGTQSGAAAGGNPAVVEVYDASTNTWTSKGAFAGSPGCLRGVAHPSGKILLFGQGYAASYDPVANTFTALTPSPTSRYLPTVTLGSDGLVYVSGGCVASGYSGTVDVYSPNRGTWSTAPSLNTARCQAAGASTSDGTMYVVGGWNGTYVRSLERLKTSAAVLVLYDSTSLGTPSFVTALQSAGFTVTLSAETAYTGSPDPSQFQAVIHLNGTTYAADMPTAGQDALVSYVNAGGGYIHGEWHAFELTQGRMQRMRDLILFDRRNGFATTDTFNVVPGQAGHPVLAGIPSSFSFYASGNIGNIHNFGTSPSTVLMRDTVGPSDAVAVRRVGRGSVVGFLDAGNYTGSQSSLKNTTIQRLYVNAVRWVLGAPPADALAPTSSLTITPGPNASGWARGTQTATIDANDGDGSGVASITYSATGATTIASTTVTGATASFPVVNNGTTGITYSSKDAAGNTEAAKTGSIKIDSAAPTLSPSVPAPSGDNGWYRGPVTVQWTAADSLSGFDAAGLPTGADTSTLPGSSSFPVTISGEGVDRTSPVTVTDRAGNNTTSNGPAVDIDSTAPSTVASAPTGWNNDAVTVALSASDNVSGVSGLRWSLNGGAPQSAAGSTANVAITADGIHSLTYWAIDVAGNAEAPRTVEVKVDRTAPVINHLLSPLPVGGWSNGPVTVTFSCQDPVVAGATPSGIASCTPPSEVSTEGAGQTVTGTAVDNAGNSASNVASVSIDTTDPTITAARTPDANSAGWNNEAVVVWFSCDDPSPGSGITPSGTVGCPASQTFGDGADQSANGTVSDQAGNSASATLTGINVDRVAPSLVAGPPSGPGDNGWFRGDVTVPWTANDALSGFADGVHDSAFSTTVTGEGANLVALATVTDQAGNATTESTSVRIDRTAPSTGVDYPAPTVPGDPNNPGDPGWHADSVTFTLDPQDVLSGVASTTWSLDGGPASPYSGPITITAPGQHVLTFSSTDAAGNVEATQSVPFKIDAGAPTISGARSPAANAAGWNNSTVDVTFTCDDDGSGVVSCVPASTTVGEGGGQSVTGMATDATGHTATATVSDISVDLTRPTLSGAPASPPNAAGWYNTDVQVNWTASDPLGLSGDASGVDGATRPGVSTLAGEGSNLGAGPVTVSDLAGNASLPASVSGIRIDRGAPNASAATDRAANGAGWFNSTVVVGFTCTDPDLADATPGSGIADCPDDVVLSGDGAGQWASGVAYDLAGNLSSAAVSGINIDSQAPTTSAVLSCTGANDWCRGESASVALDAVDQVGLSGVAEVRYSVNGGEQQVVAGDGAVVSVPLPASSGTASVAYYAVDRAGNAGSLQTATVTFDNVAPTLTHAVTPAPNAAGWNNSDAVVHFEATDDVDGSGVDAASVTPDVTVDVETAGRLVEGVAADLAGNTTTDSVVVRLDKTAPTISGATTTPANGAGWHNGPVTVSFVCNDLLSLVASCSNDSTLVADGAGQSVSGTAVDTAGNSAGATVGGINIDSQAPVTTATWAPAVPTATDAITGNGDWFGPGPVEVTLEAADQTGLSGVGVTRYRVDGGAESVYTGPIALVDHGVHTVAYWSIDNAGNVEAPRVLTFQVDTEAPSISGAATPANAHGWNNADVTVDFTCDDHGQSGVSGCGPDVVLSAETPAAGQSVGGTASDWVGNVASTSVGPIRIDRTAPTLVGLPTTPSNAAGWYNGNVSIQWEGQDGLSGIDAATLSPDASVTAEGRGLTVPGGVADKAGNPTTANSEPVDIDRGLPVVTAAVVNADGTPRAPDGAGWYVAPVVVRFTCSDPDLADGSAGSGIASCPADSVLSDNGADQSVPGVTTDQAGNIGVTTLSGIDIDSSAPVSSAALACAATSAYCTGSTATVAVTAVDQAGLSGVREVRYSVDGGGEVVVAGHTADVVVDLPESGSAVITYYGVDNAGNTESARTATVQWDNVAPTVTHTVTPAPNGAGWNRSDATVHFDAVDDYAGVVPGSVTADVVVVDETASHIVRGEATDVAGNVGHDSVEVKLDETLPTISGAATSSPNAKGWYNGPVTVQFSCGDALSGVASCAADRTLTANAADQSASGAAVDNAGNSADTTVSDIDIDAVAPVVTVGGVASGGIYTLGAVPVPSCSAADSLSGLSGPCSGSVAGGRANGVGAYTYTARATDNADNETVVSVTYRVVYDWQGFLQPINDTGHTRVRHSVFKAGSTIPVKFALKNAAGAVVQANALPQWLTPAQGSPMTAPLDETVYSPAASSGTTFTLLDDGTYQFNYRTASGQAGWFWRIGVALDDGQTHWANIALR